MNIMKMGKMLKFKKFMTIFAFQFTFYKKLSQIFSILAFKNVANFSLKSGKLVVHVEDEYYKN